MRDTATSLVKPTCVGTELGDGARPTFERHLLTILLLEKETVVLFSNWNRLIRILLVLPHHLLLLGTGWPLHHLVWVFGAHDLRKVEGTAALAERVNAIHLLVIQGRLHNLLHPSHRHASLLHLHMLHLLGHQFLVHLQGLIQILLRAGRCPSRERNLILVLLHHLIASIAVLDHTEGLCVLAPLIRCRLGH